MRYPLTYAEAMANLLIEEDEILINRDDFFIMERLRATDVFPSRDTATWDGWFQRIHNALEVDYPEIKAPKNPKQAWGMTGEEQARAEFVYDEFFDWTRDTFGVHVRNALLQAVQNKNTFFRNLPDHPRVNDLYQEALDKIAPTWEERACIIYGLSLPPPD